MGVAGVSWPRFPPNPDRMQVMLFREQGSVVVLLPLVMLGFGLRIVNRFLSHLTSFHPSCRISEGHRNPPQRHNAKSNRQWEFGQASAENPPA
jgi:hypothetical protein